MTLSASIHAGGVGEIDRLMHGVNPGEFATFAGTWRDQTVPAFTPSAAGQVRLVLPSLTLDELDDSV